MNNDLISRAAFDEVLDQFEGLKAHAAFTEGIMVARRELASAPAVDAEPVRHGRWKLNKVYADYECSECGAGDITLPIIKKLGMKYCPNCGTRMDGGAQNVNENG